MKKLLLFILALFPLSTFAGGSTILDMTDTTDKILARGQVLTLTCNSLDNTIFVFENGNNYAGSFGCTGAGDIIFDYTGNTGSIVEIDTNTFSGNPTDPFDPAYSSYTFISYTFFEQQNIQPLIIESHSVSYHIFAFTLDWMNFFMGNVVWLLFLIFGLATVGLFVGGFFYYSHHR